MKRFRVLTSAAILAAALVGLSGCSSELNVSGSVTWNGEPLPKGFIRFVDLDGKTADEGGNIVNGAFSFRAKPGTKRVEIRADREVPGAKLDPAMGAVPRHQYIPARYNDATTLEARVTASGPNTFEYKLIEKP